MPAAVSTIPSDAEAAAQPAGPTGLADRPHALIVDDDERLRALLCRYLRSTGFVVLAAESAATAGALLSRFSIDVLVLDIMMPGESGLSLTRRIARQAQAPPILLLTARAAAEQRIEGLEAGAADYLTKPFEPRELVLRLENLMRRQPPAALPIGNGTYQPERGLLQQGRETIRLTETENTLLRTLTGSPGQALSREALAAACGLSGQARSIDVQITRLRRKIEQDPRAPRHLMTVRGAGYVFRP